MMMTTSLIHLSLSHWRVHSLFSFVVFRLLKFQAYVAGEESMYDKIHEMRTRIVTSPAFSGDQVLGAILFEQTMDREIANSGMKTAQYLWQVKNIVPFLKIDQGLAAEQNGVQLMKQSITGLDSLLHRAVEHGIYGTKMRSVIKQADDIGIMALVEQQFAIGKQIMAAGLVPIIEPEVDITSPEKRECEEILKRQLLQHLDQLAPHENVILKLSLPTIDNHYQDCIAHPRVLRVVALSGGYSRDAANAILAKQTGMIASFSRALCENLSYHQTRDEFDAALATAVTSIFEASKAG
jgi:fructose-bisphosphate aldolase, class I